MKLSLGAGLSLKEEWVAFWEVMLAQSTFVVDGETEAQRCDPVPSLTWLTPYPS